LLNVSSIARLPPKFLNVTLQAACFAFHGDEEIGPKMLARLAKRTGLRPDDL
jgi:hypothetical protein